MNLQCNAMQCNAMQCNACIYRMMRSTANSSPLTLYHYSPEGARSYQEYENTRVYPLFA
jgi:hypothetical protein